MAACSVWPTPFLYTGPTAAYAQAGDATEEADFAALKAGPSISAARKFLHDHPLGKHASEAKAMLDQLAEKTAWDQAVASNTRDAYKSYLMLYWGGQFAEEARRRIQDLASARARYVAEFRQGTLGCDGSQFGNDKCGRLGRNDG
jgi:hypothetical protein